MSEIENLINDQAKAIEKLTLENQDLREHIYDFEKLAHVWKASYKSMEAQYKIKLGNAEQTIKQLEKDLEQALEDLKWK